MIHTEVAAGRKYYTYIYQENGALRELMVQEGLHTENAGEQIVPAKGFEIKRKTKCMILRSQEKMESSTGLVYTDRAESKEGL